MFMHNLSDIDYWPLLYTDCELGHGLSLLATGWPRDGAQCNGLRIDNKFPSPLIIYSFIASVNCLVREIEQVAVASKLYDIDCMTKARLGNSDW